MREFRIALNETVLVTYETKVLYPGHAVLQGADRSHRQRYDYPNGSAIVLGGLDAPERFMSGEYDMLYVPEATDIRVEGKYEMVLTRLRNGVVPYQQAITDANPGAPGHWLNQRPERCRNCGAMPGECVCGEYRPTMVRLLSRHCDNPSITPERLERLRSLTGVRRARLFEGKWVAAEGLIYDFERSRHVKAVDTTGWPRHICGCDDGTNNPFAILSARISGDGLIHIEAEHHASGMVETPKVDAARRLSAGAESIELDPSAPVKLAFRKAGLPVRDANNEVLFGISKVADRFAHNRITIDPSCVKLINELEGYEWKDNVKKDEPVKENDHAVDALRYLTARVDGGKGARIVLGYDGAEPPGTVGPPAPPPKPKSFAEMRKDPDWGWHDLI